MTSAGSAAAIGPPEALHAELQRHLEHLRVERRLAARTVAMVGAALARLQAFAAAEGVALLALQPHHVRGYVGQLRLRGLAPRSIAIVLSAWRGFFRWWGRQGMVAANPVDGLKPPKAARLLPRALAVEQAMALADTVPAAGPTAASPALLARDQAITELLYSSGLRISELLGLDTGPAAALPAGGAAPQPSRGWIDRAEGMAQVLGKASKWRSVPVGTQALAALAAWLTLRPALADAGEPALFVSRLGTRLTPNQLRNRLRAQGRQAGLAVAVNPHMLRHSFASHLLQSSGDLRAVQELMGHASIASTQVYTRLDFQHLARAYDAAHPRAKRKP